MTISKKDKTENSKPARRPSILTIAGFDSTAGAGILNDAAVFRALGYHPLAVLTSVAAQGATGVRQVRALPGAFIANQLDVVRQEFTLTAVKIGMIHGEPAVKAISEFLEDNPLPAVLDPLIWASNGKGLIRPSALPLLESRLIPLCRLVTPNLVEAETFLGRKISYLDEAAQAAVDLAERWKTAVLLKGGHLPGNPVDVLVDAKKVIHFPHARIATQTRFRGTGCSLSSAIAVGLAQGLRLEAAVGFGSDMVQKALANRYVAAVDLSIGFLGF